MEPHSVERKLTAILHADVQGYSRLITEDDAATLRTLTAYLEMMRTLVRQHGGRAVGSRGDSLLAEFPSVVEAVRCAVEMQRELKVHNAELPVTRRVEFRMGINLGEVLMEGEEIHGDGVNIAVRLEGLAEAGGICISEVVYDQIKHRLALGYEFLGEHSLKNIEKPVQVYRVLMEPGAAAPKATVGAALRGRPKGARYWQRTALAVGVVLLVAVGAVAIRNLYLRPSPPPAVVPSEETPVLELPDKPSIAVLPFVNMSEDPKQEYFSDGMTEDLITDLSKLSGLFVIARNSVFFYKGKPVKMEEVSRELGVRYVLEGSVRKADNRVRITAQLVDATTGYHLWAERYDRPLQDIFALQDEIVQKIVTTLKLHLTLWEQGVLVRKRTDNLEAYDYYLRGMEYYWRYTKETNAQARQMCEQAVELDPKYAQAYAGMGWTYLREWQFQWSQDPQNLERAFELAQKAIALDDSLPSAHNLLGHAYLWTKRHEQAIAEAERAVALDPNDAEGYWTLAFVLNYAGRPEEAVGLMEKAMRFNPHYPFIYLWDLGRAYYLTERYEEAIAALKGALTRNPDFLLTHLTLAATYSQLGREEEARAEAAEVLRISPHFSLEAWRQRYPLKDQAQLERAFANLRKAGLQ